MVLGKVGEMTDCPIDGESRLWNLCHTCDHEWYSKMGDEACPSCTSLVKSKERRDRG